MPENSPNINFEQANILHQSTILKWLDAPHVKAFWDNTPEHRDDIIIFINGRKEPSPYADGIFTYWVGSIENDPYCLLMTSEMLDEPDLPQYYREHLSKTGKTYGIDFMIGSEKHFGKGLAAPTLKAFMQYLHEHHDKSIDRFMIDPAQTNPRAKHVYEKAGFHVVCEFISTQGSFEGVKHFLLIKDT